jgi:hypothetical protein
LPLLELALAEGVMGQRQSVLRTVVGAGIDYAPRPRSLHIRRRDLAEQMTEAARGVKRVSDQTYATASNRQAGLIPAVPESTRCVRSI